MVSGEMDADRMDYLQRDAYFTGVSYGQFDQSWLLENLGFHVVEDKAYMALTHRAVFAFEDFLLSRYHMSVSVYSLHLSRLRKHARSVYVESPEDFGIPSDSDAISKSTTSPCGQLSGRLTIAGPSVSLGERHRGLSRLQSRWC